MHAVPHVAHGDVLAERRAGTPAGDDAEAVALAVGGDDLGVLARGGAVDDEPDAPPRDAAAALALGRQLREHDVGAVELGRLGQGGIAAVAADDPGERALDGRRRVVEVVPVEAHAGLEAQAVARAEPRELQPLGPRGREQRRRRRHRVRRREHDLEAVLARVTAAADERRLCSALEPRKSALPEVELPQVRARRVLQDLCQQLLGEGALERDEAEALEDFVAHLGAAPGRELLAEVREVLLPARRVGHDVEDLGPEPCDDGVVDDAACLGPQKR